MSVQPFCLTSLFLLLLFMNAVFPLSLLPFIDPESLDGLRTVKKMSEFVKHLGIPNESLCYPDKDEKADPMFHEELPVGDLIMDEEEIGDTGDEKKDKTNDIENDFSSDGHTPQGKPKKTAKKPKKWPNGIIPYYTSKDFNKKQKKEIENAIEDMNSKLTSVYFRPVEKSDRNYAVIFNGKGCYAKLGMKGGPQPVSLQTDKCLSRGTIQHELLHIVGFRHEQNRPDRNNYIEVIYNNIPEKWLKNYKRYKSSQANFVGEYDYYSVLHYPLQAPNNEGGKYAIIIFDEDVDKEKVGEQKGMTDKDIEKVEELYGNES